MIKAQDWSSITKLCADALQIIQKVRKS